VKLALLLAHALDRRDERLRAAPAFRMRKANTRRSHMAIICMMDLTTAKNVEAEALVNALEDKHLTQLVGFVSQVMTDEPVPLHGGHLPCQRLPVGAPCE
jgi:hypothetical protein